MNKSEHNKNEFLAVEKNLISTHLKKKKKSLIIFTRYPEIGKTKTRLIPAIGEQKATYLHKLMTEKTLEKVKKLSKNIEIEINIYFNGGSKNLMKQWLGNDYLFFPQSIGDLGNKMYSAFVDNFSKGNEQVIIIGVDCLELTGDILKESFVALDNFDTVIGKALDGGYYLLGLNSLEKSLFENINWGTNLVFSQTISAIENLNLTIHHLSVLRDIDRPEDLCYIPSEWANFI